MIIIANANCSSKNRELEIKKQPEGLVTTMCSAMKPMLVWVHSRKWMK
jgi:hypothetical protein